MKLRVSTLWATAASIVAVVSLQATKPITTREVATGLFVREQMHPLSCSSDGKWAAIDLSHGSALIRIEDGELFDANLAVGGYIARWAWSPVESTLAVQSFREGRPVLKIWKAGEESATEIMTFPKKMDIAREGFITWSPDGKYVFIKANIWLAQPKSPPSGDNPPNVSPNANIRLAGYEELAFKGDIPHPDRPELYDGAYGEFRRSIVLMVDVAQRQVRTICQGNDLKSLFPSPDGKHLAFVQSKMIVPTKESMFTQQALADLFVVALPEFATLPTTDLEKYDDRSLGAIDWAGKRLDPVLRDLHMLAFEGSRDLAWSPRGDAFTFATRGKAASGDVYLYDVTARILRNLTEKITLSDRWKDNNFVGNRYPGLDRSARFGRSLPPIWISDASAVLAVARGDLWLIPVDGAVPRNLTANTPLAALRVVDRNQSGTAQLGEDGSIVVFAKDPETRLDSILRINLASGQIGPRQDTGRWTNDGVCGLPGGIVYSGQGENTMRQLWQLPWKENAAPRAITKFKEELEQRQWPEYRRLHWRTPAGLDGYGLLFLPPHTEGQRLPLVFQALPGADSSVLDQRLEAGALWLNNGYGVDEGQGVKLMPLLQRGIAVLRADVPLSAPGVYAEPMKEIVAGVDAAVDAALATGAIDAAKMAITGASQDSRSNNPSEIGGYMVMAVAVSNHRFVAGIASGSYDNLIAHYDKYGRQSHNIPGSEWRYFEEAAGRMGTTFWQDPQRYLQNSPYTFLDRVQMPLLLVSEAGLLRGFFDTYYNPASQTFNSLARLNKQVVLTSGRNPDEEAIRMRAWLEQHLLGAPPTAHIAQMPSYLSNGEVPESEKSKEKGDHR